MSTAHRSDKHNAAYSQSLKACHVPNAVGDGTTELVAVEVTEVHVVHGTSAPRDTWAAHGRNKGTHKSLSKTRWPKLSGMAPVSRLPVR